MPKALTPIEREYLHWTDSLGTTRDPFYYENLLKFAVQISNDLIAYKQHFIAKKLHMTGPKFSIVKQLLEAQARIVLNEGE